MSSLLANSVLVTSICQCIFIHQIISNDSSTLDIHLIISAGEGDRALSLLCELEKEKVPAAQTLAANLVVLQLHFYRMGLNIMLSISFLWSRWIWKKASWSKILFIKYTMCTCFSAVTENVCMLEKLKKNFFLKNRQREQFLQNRQKWPKIRLCLKLRFRNSSVKALSA